MFKKNFFWFLLVTIGFTSATLKADHIVGGEFSYECMGFVNNDTLAGIMRYRILINMYRDCVVESDGSGNAWFDGDPQVDGPNGEPGTGADITIYRGNQLYEPTRNITLSSWRPVDINLGNPCLVVNDEICQQIGIYDFTVDLPLSEDTYTLTYQRCCRNSSITNMINSGVNGTTYFIQITPEAQQLCNASPLFNIDPPIAICINETFQIDMGATDRENDSLHYSLCYPVIGGGTDGSGATTTTFDDIVPRIESPPPYRPITFNAPLFSVNNQLGLGSELQINPDTGTLTGLPIYIGTFVLSVCIEEWTRGPNPILLSETKREFQLNVSLCENQVFADLLETEIDDQGRFFIKQCGPGENTIINESTHRAFITEYDWELTGPDNNLITGNNRDFTTNIDRVGIYSGIMILNRNSIAENCRDTALFNLGVFPPTVADFTFSDTGCDDEPVSFTDNSSTEADEIIGWTWNFADGSDPNNQANPDHPYTYPGNFPVQLTVTDNNGCEDETTIPVPYFPSPRTLLVEPDNGFGCLPYSRYFDTLSQPTNDDYLFEWEFGDGGTSSERNPTHIYNQAGVYDVYLAVTSPTGCFVDTTFRRLVDVRNSPMSDFIWSPEQVSNLYPDFTVFDRSEFSSSVRYVLNNYAGQTIFTTPLADFDYRLRDTSSVLITQYVSHPSGCVDSLTKVLKLTLRNSFFMPDAFTPNGDGLNDQLLPTGIMVGATNYLFRVWNRWGELIFSTESFDSGWDGTKDGTQSPAGGYLWDVQFTDIGGKDQAYKGGAVLIR